MRHKLHNARSGRVTLMVLSKAAPTAGARPRASVGRPVGRETLAIEAAALREESAAFAELVRARVSRIHLAVVAERPAIVVATARELTALADRRLRQLGGDAA